MTPSSTPEPGDGQILKGVFETGFEHSGFYANAVCPEGTGSFWVSWTPESMFAERLEGETGVDPFSEPDVLAFRVTVRGEVSPPGEYGHLGQYPREVTVFELIDAEIANDCDDVDEPSGSVGPPAVVASDTDGNQVQLGLGSYCWQGGVGQPGLCADTFGHITNVEPLVVAAGETVFLRSELVLADAEIGLRAWSVENDQPLASDPDWLAWAPSDLSKPLAVAVGNVGVGNVGVGNVGVAFEVDLAPGLYVVSAFVVVTQGDVSYGLLLRVDSSAPSDDVSLGVPVMLGVGQAVGIAGGSNTLTFAGVVSDSRCPADVVCVWAGEALLAFELTAENSVTTRSISFGTGSAASGVLGPYRLTLVQLEPEPRSTPPIPPGSYEATIVLDRLPPLPSGSGIEGVVTLGPLCPVMRAGVACPDRVYAATLVLLDTNDVEVDRLTSGADGYYRMAATPGQYKLVPQSPPGLPLPFAGAITVEIGADEWTTVDVGYESGIR